MEEQQAITLARSGDKVAFGELVSLYKNPILRYLYRLTGDFEKASDLTQDTFVKAYKNLNDVRVDSNFKAWLYRIATNEASSHWRRVRILSFISFDGAKSPDKTQDSTTIIEDKITTRDALKKVPLNQRQCLVLHFVEGFKYREIASTLGISEDAVSKRIERGKEAFKHAYNGGTSNEM